VKQNIAPLLASARPEKSIGQNSKKFSRLLVIVLTALSLFSLRTRVIDKSAHLLALLRFRDCLPVEFDHAINARRIRLGDPSLDGLVGLPVNLEIKPVGMIVAARIEFSLNCLPHRVARSLRTTGESREKKSCEREKPSPEHVGPPVEPTTLDADSLTEGGFPV
jgi:hypothetical protein